MSDAESPSWAAAPQGSSPASEERERRRRGSVPVTLALAAGLTAVIAVFEIVHILGRSELVPALRVFLSLIVGSQLGLAWGLLRRSSGAALGVYLCMATAFLAAVAGGLGDGAVRPLLAIGAVAVIGLLSASMRGFPSPQLPALPSGPFE